MKRSSAATQKSESKKRVSHVPKYATRPQLETQRPVDSNSQGMNFSLFEFRKIICVTSCISKVLDP
jgi:hypothetical protein